MLSTDASQPGALVVFGGASGIGLATAEKAVRQGRKVVIADLSPEGRDLDVVQAGGVLFQACDATDVQAVRTVLEKAMEQFGRLGGVVTTVGGAHLHDPFEVNLPAWRREIVFNLDSAYVVATTAAELMKRQGGGAIVTTSSTFAQLPRGDRVGYSAAKAGVIGLTKSLADAAAPYQVRINCVAPHSTDTPRFRAMVGEAGMELRLASSPLRRICVPEDMADSILFLLSDQARSFTGQVLWVNNGSFMP